MEIPSNDERPSVGIGTRTASVSDAATALHEAPDRVPVNELEQGQNAKQRHAPFACNVCKQTYSRVDHLARHYRSHTQEKPFPCDVCGKTFARADLVKRHATCHTEDGSKKRKRRSWLGSRTSNACTACASAKLKCENEKPCLRCVKKGLDCTPVSNGTFGKRLGSHAEVDIEDCEPANNTPPSAPVSPRHEAQPYQGTQEGTAHTDLPLPQQTHDTLQPEVYSDFASYESNAQLDNNQAMNMFSIDTFQVERAPPITDMDEQFNASGNLLGDFLATIMSPFSPVELGPGPPSNGTSDSLIRDVFDFGIDADFNLRDIDLDLFDLTMPPPPLPIYQQNATSENQPSRGELENETEVDPASVEAFQRSLWRWTPGQTDQGHCEQINLSVPYNIGAPNAQTPRPCGQVLNQLARDAMLAMVLGTCDREAVPRIVTTFPSSELLDHLMQEYLILHDQEPDPFIHIPTFRPQSVRPELLAATVFFGAVRSPAPVVRRLGFALQESVRLALPKTFEKDNSMTRDLQLLQANILELKLGLWSGNRRKMEIAESHGLPLVTMLRRAGRFKRLRKQPAAPTPDDSPEALETKWQAWVEAESFKRLVYFIAVYDAHLSMSFHVPPLITYGEISLDLPTPMTLWKAKSASKWAEEYMAYLSTNGHHPPAGIACVHTAQDMLEAQYRIDLGFSVDIALSRFWKVIWDARQLQTGTKQHAAGLVTASLTSGHWQHELSQTLRNFCMIIGEAEPLSSATNLMHEYLLLNVYVSFEELSLFAGKEGHREARRAYPSLKKWADSRDSRQALWHAGQVLREATTFPSGTLFGFHAVSLYHAGLTLWAYGLLTNGLRQEQKHGTNKNRDGPVLNGNSVVFLDGIETGDVQKFVALNRATPAICQRRLAVNGANKEEAVFLDNSEAVMATVAAILQSNYQTRRFTPTLVENLVHLMGDLGKAATNKINSRA